MARFLTCLAGFFALGLAIVSIFANFWFGTLLAAGSERWLYGGVFALLDSFKTVLPILAAFAIAAGLFLRAGIALTLFTMFTALSFTAEIGLYATTKSEVVGDAKAAHEKYQQAKAAKATADAAVIAIGRTRSIGAIEGELAALKRNHKFDRSKQCTDATAPDSRGLCAEIDVLRGELRTAYEAASLRQNAAEATLVLDKQDVAAAMRKIDPQAEALAKLFGVFGIVAEPDTVRTGLAVLIALLIELGSGLGPWLASPTVKRNDKPAPNVEPITNIERVIIRSPPAIAIETTADDGLVARWANESLVSRRGAFVTAKEARTGFQVWCAMNDVEPLNATAFGKAMTALGYERNKVGGANRYDGIALVPVQPTPLRLAVNNSPSVLGRMATVGVAE